MALLEVRGLGKRFGGVQAVRALDVDLAEGELAGLIGPNGAGKTTAFNAITGYLRPSHGRVSWDSAPLGSRPCDIARRGVVRTFQKTSVFPTLTVFDNVRTGLHLRARASLWSVLAGTRSVRTEEAQIAEAAHAVIEFVGLGDRRLHQRQRRRAGAALRRALPADLLAIAGELGLRRGLPAPLRPPPRGIGHHQPEPGGPARRQLPLPTARVTTAGTGSAWQPPGA